jgi:hypothetical protein
LLRRIPQVALSRRSGDRFGTRARQFVAGHPLFVLDHFFSRIGQGGNGGAQRGGTAAAGKSDAPHGRAGRVAAGFKIVLDELTEDAT